MKKIVLLSIVLVTLASCGGKKSQGDAEDSSWTEVTSEDSAIAADADPTVYITKDSIGLIHIGQSVNYIPSAVGGLYTSKENGASEDAVTILFKGPEGDRFIAYDFGEGVIDVLNLIDTVVKVKSPEGDFGIGDSFAYVLNLPGVEQEWSGYDNSGTWYWKWEGLWFAPSQESVTDSLSKRLYNPDVAPTADAFDKSVTVGFIGTGLPF